MLGIDPQERVLLVNKPFQNHIMGDLERGLRGALAVAGLKDEELAAFHGQLDVLHVAVVRLQLAGDALELAVDVRHVVGQFFDGARGAHARHHVLALRVDQVFAVKLALARGGVAGEGHAAARIVPHVAEDHALDIDRRTEVVIDLVQIAVDHGPVVVPRAEDRLDGQHELLVDVIRERPPGFLKVEGLAVGNDGVQGIEAQLLIQPHALRVLALLKEGLKLVLGDFHDHVGKHLNETAVGVAGEPLVARVFGQRPEGGRIQAEIEHGIHHAGHGEDRARAHGQEERLVRIAETLARLLFQGPEVARHFLIKALRQALPVTVIIPAGVRSDDQARRDRKAEVGHLRKVRPLAAQQFLHSGVTFMEQIHVPHTASSWMKTTVFSFVIRKAGRQVNPVRKNTRLLFLPSGSGNKKDFRSTLSLAALSYIPLPVASPRGQACKGDGERPHNPAPPGKNGGGGFICKDTPLKSTVCPLFPDPYGTSSPPRGPAEALPLYFPSPSAPSPAPGPTKDTPPTPSLPPNLTGTIQKTGTIRGSFPFQGASRATAGTRPSRAGIPRRFRWCA